jgi:hypothetical protein
MYSSLNCRRNKENGMYLFLNIEGMNKIECNRSLNIEGMKKIERIRSSMKGRRKINVFDPQLSMICHY